MRGRNLPSTIVCFAAFDAECSDRDDIKDQAASTEAAAAAAAV